MGLGLRRFSGGGGVLLQQVPMPAGMFKDQPWWNVQAYASPACQALHTRSQGRLRHPSRPAHALLPVNLRLRTRPAPNPHGQPCSLSQATLLNLRPPPLCSRLLSTCAAVTRAMHHQRHTQYPEEAGKAMRWAQAHDDEARALAAAAQACACAWGREGRTGRWQRGRVAGLASARIPKSQPQDLTARRDARCTPSSLGMWGACGMVRPPTLCHPPPPAPGPSSPCLCPFPLQALVTRYLHKRALMCYWWKLLTVRVGWVCVCECARVHACMCVRVCC